MQGVGHLLEGRQHGLPVVVEGGLVRLLGRLAAGGQRPAVKDRPRYAADKTPGHARGTRHEAFSGHRGAEIEPWIKIGRGDAHLGARRMQPRFRRPDIRPRTHQLRRHG